MLSCPWGQRARCEGWRWPWPFGRPHLDLDLALRVNVALLRRASSSSGGSVLACLALTDRGPPQTGPAGTSPRISGAARAPQLPSSRGQGPEGVGEGSPARDRPSPPQKFHLSGRAGPGDPGAFAQLDPGKGLGLGLRAGPACETGFQNLEEAPAVAAPPEPAPEPPRAPPAPAPATPSPRGPRRWAWGLARISWPEKDLASASSCRRRREEIEPHQTNRRKMAACRATRARASAAAAPLAASNR